MRKYDMDKYFAENSFSVLDVSLTGVVIVSACMTLFTKSLSFVSIPILIISGIILAILRAGHIREDEVDELLKGLSIEAYAKSDPENTVETYDFRHGPVKKGKDGVWRSGYYYYTTLSVSDRGTKLTVISIDLFTQKNTFEELLLPPGEKLTLKHEDVKTPYGTKRAYYLVGAAIGEREIPVTLSDVFASDLVYKIAVDG